MPDLRGEGFTQADAEIIRHKVHKLIGRHGYTSSDREDLQQDLALHVSKSAAKHDPQRGARSTFVDRIVANKIAHILEHRQAQKRGGGSKIVPVDETSGAFSDKCVSADSTEMGVDVRIAMESLTSELRGIAILLGIYSASEVMSQLGLTRGQFRERQKAIREHFENSGLNPNPPQPTRHRTR